VSTRESQKQKRKEQIVEVAKQLFLAQGIQDVQLQDIANEVGIGIATFYRYFPNKELLVIAVNNTITQEMTAHIEKITAEPIPAYDQLEKVLDYFIEVTHEPEQKFIRFVKAFEAYRPTSVESLEHASYIQVRRKYADVLFKIAEKGKLDRSIRDDIDLGFAIFTLVQNLSYFTTESSLTVHDPTLPVDLNAEKQVILLKDIFLNYMRPIH
jgi:AcrR family transcriptional regulator